MTARLRQLGLVSSATGLVALVAPFTADLSPLDGMALGIEGEGVFVFSIAAASLLAVPIAAWQIRRVFAPAAAKLECVLAYFFSTAAMLPVLIVSFPALSGENLGGDVSSVVALAVYWCAVIGNVALWIRNRHEGEPPSVTAEVFLLLGYLPNSSYALILFSYWGLVFGPSWMWDVGAYIVLATCVMYAAQAVLLIRQPTFGSR